MRWYGLAGLAIILAMQLNFYFKIEPLASWYFPIIWIGYILVVDALVYKLKGTSLITNKPKKLFWLALISVGIWWVFELINFFVGNWSYHNATLRITSLFANLSFATVIPAVFETSELLLTLHWFDNFKLPHKYPLSKNLASLVIILGLVSLILPILFPTIFFPLIWLSIFFVLDPINYMNGQSSMIRHLQDRRLKIPLAFAIGALICGFFWEFWNYWAVPKWTYSVPYVGFLKIFEMPLLGYLGYLPFGLELYAVVVFASYSIKRFYKKV